MEHWVSYPFVRFLLFFLSGILATIFIAGEYLTGLYIGLISCTAIYLLLLIFYNPQLFYSKNILYSILCSLTLFFAGAIITKQKDKEPEAHKLETELESCRYFKAKIIGETERKGNFYKITARVEKIKTAQSWKTVDIDIILWIKNEIVSDPFYGQTYLFNGNLTRISGANYYKSFDPQKYYRYKNIFYQSTPFKLLPIDTSPDSYTIYHALVLKDYFARRFSQFIKDKEALGITEGIILGKRDGISSDVRDIYSGTGAMHLLSVSGLHIGLLYQLLLFLLNPLVYLPRGKFIRFISISLLLIGYALLTGLVPPVLRSTIMFLIFLIAKTISKKQNPYNTLAISALIILIYDPFTIADIGFQLTYLAMGGLIFLQPKLSVFYEPKRWLDKQVWGITTGGIAATIITFPISLYYFHSFPVYFSLSNLIVAPLSYVILWLGIFGLIFSWTDVVLKPLCYCLEKSIWFMNEGLRYILKIPKSVIRDIYIDAHHMLFLYILMILLILIFFGKKIKLVIPLLILSLVFSGIVIYEKVNIRQQRDVIAFFVKGKKVFAGINGRVAEIYADSAFNENKLKFEIYPALLNRGVKAINFIKTTNFRELKSFNIIHCGNKNILTVKDKTILDSISYLSGIDLLIYEPSSRGNFEESDLKAESVVINKKYKKVTVDKNLSKNINLHVTEPNEYFSLSIEGD
ncbi:MAG: ComEC/Rec2 family competence protein [Sporocytophaga sp.]|uniref:ComEC/Rec2 family competence protein n=1 Tax=Sporocytophaga sp. TaxID=2231183 RepID=UPI001B0B09C1|nr:ComEC/Rec2 family competence protein [Sporocytophaga sp.]MBO9703073.1 ComEC/Rec2 family competence protein [Sporocytophaga sp.]